MSDAGTASPPPRRRWRQRLLVLAALLVALSLVATWLLQPKQLVPLILDRAGEALSLQITASPDAEARLRGTPQLVVHDLAVREPGGDAVLLRAKRVLLSLPWSSVRSGGKDIVIRRIELDAPELDLAAVRAWLAKRPPSEETAIPTLTDGLRVIDGRVVDGTLRIEDLAIDLPALHPQRRAHTRIRGRAIDGALKLPFDLVVAMSRPANGAGLGIVGTLAFEGDDWRLPVAVKLSGPLRIGGDGIAMTPATLGASARYESGDTRLPFALGLRGPLRIADGTATLAPAGVALRGDGTTSIPSTPIPTLDAHGAMSLGKRLILRLDGTLPHWPETWPALPPPISTSTSPLPFALQYEGRMDLSDTTALSLRRDAMAFDSRFRLPALLDWLGQAGGSPLPPLDGTLRAPQMTISGATLEGVQVTLDEEEIE
ncbi:MAG: hypothetical protein KF800_12565 [Lysobacter sp.]|nr:hypothetical protein [Lysobacter sp.]